MKVSWRELRDVAKLAGCVEERIKGDHLIMSRSGMARPIVIKMDDRIREDIVRSENARDGPQGVLAVPESRSPEAVKAPVSHGCLLQLPPQTRPLPVSIEFSARSNEGDRQKHKRQPHGWRSGRCVGLFVLDQSSLMDFFVFSLRDESLAAYSCRQSSWSTMAHPR